MTPEQAERLRDLFYAARKTTRAVALDRTADDLAADDAAVDAFNAALKEATSSDDDAPDIDDWDLPHEFCGTESQHYAHKYQIFGEGPVKKCMGKLWPAT